MPQVSVIMSVYQEKTEWLISSIESILQQTYTDFEFIIVVDNPEIVELIKIIKTFAQKDIRVKFFINDKNKGLIYSLNRALENTHGKYIARMDADDISHPDRLKKQLQYLECNNLDLIGSNIHLFKNNNEIFYTTDKLLTHVSLRHMLKNGAIGIVHPTFFGKEKVFKQLNGYTDSLYTEDMEFLARVFCNDFKVGNIKEVLLDCRYNDSSITKTNAFVMYENAKYVTRIFRSCLKNGKYDFSQQNVQITKNQQNNFNKKQILMSEAREAFTHKKYIGFIVKIVKATYYSKSIFSSLKINLVFKLLKILENRTLKGKNK